VEKQDPITVWGSGEQVRDFIYIEDVVDITMATMNQLDPGEALNLGSGSATSFNQLANIACQVLGHEAKIVNDPSKPEGVFFRVADTHKMFRFARPTVFLDEGIRRVANYIRELDKSPTET
jgi:GDP-L-fucose synthase